MRPCKYHLETCKNALEEIKKHDKKNYPMFVRSFNLYYEVYRLELVLARGFLSKQMFNKLTFKFLKLREEFNEIEIKLMRMDKENKLEKYHVDFLNNRNYKNSELEFKYKIKKCPHCDIDLIYYNDDFCEDCWKDMTDE